jgi:hypothetical protein
MKKRIIQEAFEHRTFARPAIHAAVHQTMQAYCGFRYSIVASTRLTDIKKSLDFRTASNFLGIRIRLRTISGHSIVVLATLDVAQTLGSASQKISQKNHY